MGNAAFASTNHTMFMLLLFITRVWPYWLQGHLGYVWLHVLPQSAVQVT